MKIKSTLLNNCERQLLDEAIGSQYQLLFKISFAGMSAAVDFFECSSLHLLLPFAKVTFL